MNEIPDTRTTCDGCKGSGLLEGKVCVTCMGTGSVPVKGLSLIFKYLKERIDDLEDRVNDVLDKCNGILEEVRNS